MPRIFDSLPQAATQAPKTPIGLAFSGGLDTRAAVLWLSRRGAEVHAYTADLAQPDETDPRTIPPVAIDHGAARASLVDCKEALANEAIVALQCGAFHLATAGKKYFNTTPLGRAVTATAIVTRMLEDGVHIFGDGSTHKGNDIQRFYRYGLRVNPALRIYKPWLDAAFVAELGGRAEMSALLASAGKTAPASAEKAYSTDANLLGATHEAKDLERLDTSMKVVTPIMGVRHVDPSVAIATESVTVELEAGVPIAIGGARFGSAAALFAEANAVGGRHGLGMSDQIENRVIEAKSRGVYEAPGMALLHVAYERLASAIFDEGTLDLFAREGRRLGRLLYEGRWFDPEAIAIKSALTKLATVISGAVTLELRRGDDYTILATEAENATYAEGKLSMERSADALFSERDRIGALEVQNLSIDDARDLAAKLG